MKISKVLGIVAQVATFIFAALVILIIAFAAVAEAAVCVEAGQVSISWQLNSESDISHYNIYKAFEVDGSYLKVNALPIIAPPYVVIGLGEGTCFFKVSAVDQCNNESEMSVASEAVTIDTTPPAKPATPQIVITTE